MLDRPVIDLREVLRRGDAGDAERIDWNAAPWDAAQPGLHWLGLAPPRDDPPTTTLTTDDAALLCDHMMARIVVDSGELAWSSFMLQTALEAIARGLGGAPEPLLQGAWRLLESRPLDANVHAFCRALGRQTLGRLARDEAWDLHWMLEDGSDSQVCLRYWLLALRPGHWDDGVIRASLDVLERYPFEC